MANTDKNIGAKVSIFPNPGNNLLQINNEATEGVGYQILDVFGRIITKGEAGAGSSAKLNTANWVSGVYYVVVLSENQVIVSTTKWVKL